MLLLSLALTCAALLLYVFSPGQLIYSSHPVPVYLLLAGSLLALWKSGAGKLRLMLMVFVPALAAGIVYVHSVKSQTSGGTLTLAIGDRFPEVRLPTSTGTVFSSSQLGHAALYLFYRGDWCPFCRTELSALNDYYGAIRGAGVDLLAVSVDPPDVSERLRQHLGVPFTFLSDTEGKLLDSIGIRHRGGHGDSDIAYPAQVLVDRDGIVRWTFRADSYRQRAHPEDILRAITALGTPHS